MGTKTIATLALAVLAVPGLASAADSTGCGLGTKLFDGESGVGPQVLAVTTNGTFGNQTFGISSGTLGCDTNGTIDYMADVSEFTNDNMDRLAADMAAGEGETLATVGNIIGIAPEDRQHFNRVMQQNFARIYPTTTTTADEVVASMQAVMAEDSRLSAYLSQA